MQRKPILNIIARMPIVVNDRLSSVLLLYDFPDILIIVIVTEGDAMNSVTNRLFCRDYFVKY